MPTDSWLPLVKTPVLIVHGDHDRLIPISHAEALRKIRPQTEMLVIPDAGHNDIHKFPAYLDGLAERLLKL